MFAFFKPKPKTSAEFLEGVRRKFATMDDLGKMKFLKTNISAIKSAMETVPESVPHYQSPADRAAGREEKTTEEWASGYLSWHYIVLANLVHQNFPTKVEDLSDEARLFVEETKVKAEIAFRTLFNINPVDALQSLNPHELYLPQIKTALESLVSHDDPRLFFDCVDEVSFRGNSRNQMLLKSRFTNEITCLIQSSLENLLQKEPQEFLAARHNLVYPDDYPSSYIDYLPKGTIQQFFVQDHFEKISSIIRDIAPNATNDQHETVESLRAIFTDEERPVELDDLKKLLSSERIKTLFSMAADPARPNISAMVQTISSKETDRDFVRSTGDYNEFGEQKPYTLMCLTNPAEDKHLWLVKKSQKTLAASFTAAGLRGYLETQRQFDADEMASVAEFDQFAGIKLPEAA